MPLFRCLECRKEFEAALPACTACGIDPAADPRDADLVVPLVTVHFDPPTRRTGRGCGHAACDPKLKVGAGAAFSGEPRAVNCAACKASAPFVASGGVANSFVNLPLTPKGG
jgi:hypothetical protein